MPKRKFRIPYYVSVEGYTEKAYLEFVKQIVNKASKNKVLDFKYPSTDFGGSAKKVVQATLTFPKILQLPRYAVCDVERGDNEHRKAFSEAVEIASHYDMPEIKICYSNVSIELWILLHKCEFQKCKNPNNYLKLLNECFNKHFRNMSELKRHDNINSIIQMIGLDDIKHAINEAEKIRNDNSREFGARTYERKKINKNSYYYINSCDTNMDIFLKRIFKDMGIK